LIIGAPQLIINIWVEISDSIAEQCLTYITEKSISYLRNSICGISALLIVEV